MRFLFVACLTIAQISICRASWNNTDTPAPVTDDSQPVDRAYIVPRVEPYTDGAKITVDVFHKYLEDPLKFTLQAAVNQGGTVLPVDIQILANRTIGNQASYRSTHTFVINYDEINKWLAQRAPNSKNLRIGPETPLFVHALFKARFEFENDHQWGGLFRSGLIYLPQPSNRILPPVALPVAADGSILSKGPEALDVAHTISQAMANQYNVENGTRGLKIGGQVRSRLEAEGKFEVPLDQLKAVQAKLFALAQNPEEATRILGPEWKISLKDRYMKRDQKGELLRDSAGYPIPDPMVDTYYDDLNFSAAKNNIAIRYRYTEGNQVGAWNLKPGMGVTTPDGVVYRIEYGLDTTDEKADSIKNFADSSDALNIFKYIQSAIPGAKPSEFMRESVKLIDTRYKFELVHESGLLVEMSLDDVVAISLRPNAKGKFQNGRFAQLEMDIDHLSTKSSNSAGNSTYVGSQFSTDQERDQYLASASDRAFFDGRPAVHTQADLDPSSSLRTLKASDFQTAEAVIAKIRDHALGASWVAAGQKYAIATSVAGLCPMDGEFKARSRAARKNLKILKKLNGKQRRKVPQGRTAL